MTAPLSLGQIRDSGLIEAEALAELETVEELAVEVEFWAMDIEPEAELAMLELDAEAVMVLLTAAEEETALEEAAEEGLVEEASEEEALVDEAAEEEILEAVLLDAAALEEAALEEDIWVELLSEAKAVVVPLRKAEEDIELEETLAEEVAKALDVWLTVLIIELVELEKMLEEVELDMMAEVELEKTLLDEPELAVLLVEATEELVVVELLWRDVTMAKSVPGEATLLFLLMLLK